MPVDDGYTTGQGRKEHPARAPILAFEYPNPNAARILDILARGRRRILAICALRVEFRLTSSLKRPQLRAPPPNTFT